MIRFKELFSEGLHPKTEIIYYVVSVIFIVTAFAIGIRNNPPGIIMLVLAVFIFAFPFVRSQRGKKLITSGNTQNTTKNY
jgi:hypothetical protein